MNSNDQLLPCPFCGSANIENRHDDGIAWIRCNACGATGPELSKYSGEEGEPCTDWNTRAQLPAGGAVPEDLRAAIMSADGVLSALTACTTPLERLKRNHGEDWAKAVDAVRRELLVALAAAPHPVSGEQKAASVQITGHLDEIDAPVWEFINAEARKLGPATGSIDTYNFARPNGAQPNGVVAVLWKGASIHAMAVTVRDSLNRTQCVRLLADAPPAAQDVGGLVDALQTIYDEDPQSPGDVSEGRKRCIYRIRKIAQDALAAHRAQQGGA